jgi:hypothetical protein
MDRRIVMSRLSASVVGLTRTIIGRRWLLASAAAVALAGPAAVARAGGYDRYDDHRYGDRHDDRYDSHPRTRVDVDIRIGEPHPGPRYEERRVSVWVPPVYRTVCDRRWVEPVYRTVVDRRWVEPVYRTECDRVWVPDLWETREVRYRDGRGGWCTRRERVLVRPGHYETRERRVCVAEDRWETCERRELACDGHFENVERQELVCAGHYETRIERVPCEPRRDPVGVINPLLADLGVRR